MRRAAPKLICMGGDEVAEETFMGRCDLISLMALVSSILMLTGMAVAIPAEPVLFASICRSRADGIAVQPKAVPATPVATRLKSAKDA